MIILRSKKRNVERYIQAHKTTNLSQFLNEAKKRRMESKRPIMCDLNLVGYFADASLLPCEDGIYVAFAKKENDQPSDYKLLYIGIGTGTDCIRKRVGDHIRDDHKSAKWLKHYDPATEEIVYSYAVMNDVRRILEIENALIFKVGPLVNDNYTSKVNSEAISITINCKGDIGCLKGQYYWDKLNG